MTARTKHNAGFTFAELLTAVAIMLVLAALAFPSIVAAQNNMRMLELDNAAKSIANAAQAQMTAKKVAGTWLALVENADGKNVYPAAKNTTDEDVRYMTASSSGSGTAAVKGARDNDIIPSLSIDDGVRNGDYVIVFKKSTASVVAVYYTDGKTGFFGSSPQGGTTAAQNYYENEGASTDQTTRMNHNPMIGYYGGTPANATNEIALANPVIWPDTDNMLCVRDHSIATLPKAKTSTQITISKKSDPTVSFIIFGLQSINGQAPTTCNLGVSTDQMVNFSNLPDNLITMASSDGSKDTDTYVLDLPAIRAHVSATRSESDEDTDYKELVEALAKFSDEDDIEIKAVISSSSPSVPSKAAAYWKWPNTKKLQVLITDPYAVWDSKQKPTGTPFTVDLVSDVGDEIGPKDVTEQRNIVSDVPKISKHDAPAFQQCYTGVEMLFTKAADKQAKVRAVAGAVNSRSNYAPVKSHQYVVYEIYVNETCIGSYDDKGQWTWWSNYEQGDRSDQPSYLDVDLKTTHNGAFGATITGVTVDAAKLREALGDQSYAVYIRTAPSVSEVYKFFGTVSYDLYSKLFDFTQDGMISSRNTHSQSTNVIDLWITEFGCSSSIAAFSVERVAESKDGANAVNAISYMPTPFVAGTSSSLAGRTPSVAVMQTITRLSGKYQMSEYTAIAQRFSPDDARIQNGDPRTCTLERFVDPTVSAEGVHDFVIPSAQNYLFFRSLEYYDGDTRLTGDAYRQDWVPLYGVNLGSGETNQEETLVDPGKSLNTNNLIFANWVTSSASYSVQNPVADSQNETRGLPLLPLGTLTLKADFKEAIVGLFYLEFGTDAYGNQVVGYYGYKTDTQEKPDKSLLSNDAKINDCGYFVVTNTDDVPVMVDGGGMPSYIVSSPYSETIENVLVDKTAYTCYRLKVGDKNTGFDLLKRQNYAMRLGIKDESGKPVIAVGTFVVNGSFACAVETNANKAATWGTESSPWIVRYANQFIGCLTQTNSSPVQQTYAVKNHFLQTHDIDMADAPLTSTTKFTAVFTDSVYDGGSNAMLNIQYRFENGNIVGENSGVTGLFTRIQGSTIKNVQIKLNPMGENEYMNIPSTHTHTMSFGVLVGDVLDSGSDAYAVIDNCSLSVLSDTGNGQANIVVDRTRGTAISLGNAGGLIGKASKVQVANCSITDVYFRLKTSVGDWLTSPTVVGGIVGNVSEGMIANCSFVNSGIALDQIAQNELVFGGIVGNAGAVVESNCTVKDVAFQMPYKQNRAKVTAGIIAGTASAGSCSDNASDGIYCYYSSDSDFEIEAVLSEIGRQS